VVVGAVKVQTCLLMAVQVVVAIMPQPLLELVLQTKATMAAHIMLAQIRQAVAVVQVRLE
jgi:hypothetical protein